MTNEIKELLEHIEILDNTDYILHSDKAKALLDYITNLQQIEKDHQKLNGELREEIKTLQEELEDLRESDWAWHQTLKVQNKREYRSKFLKDFQKEYGTNVFPDYDEIYKRYDKMKKENERLKDELKRLHNLLNSQAYQDLDNYKLKNEKAIRTLETLKGSARWERHLYEVDYLLNILKGSDDND